MNGRTGYDEELKLKPTKTELTFAAFRAANLARCAKWHPNGIESWSPADWMTAVTGELGELASLLKMRNRERDNLPGNKFSPTNKMVADEIADLFSYLDLLAAVLGVDLGQAVVSKFNEVSERVGFSDRINLATVVGAAPVGTGWTSVEDRMPEIETPVLILLKGAIRVGERRIEEPGWGDNHKAYAYWDDPYDDGQCWEDSSVTHWCSIPALPVQPKGAK